MFGTHHKKILDLVQKKKSLGKRISEFHPDIMAEVIYCLKHEHVKKLSDFLQRRSGIGSGEGQGLDCVDIVATVFARHFKWSSSKKKKEIAEYKKEVSLKYPIDF